MKLPIKFHKNKSTEKSIFTSIRDLSYESKDNRALRPLWVERIPCFQQKIAYYLTPQNSLDYNKPKKEKGEGDREGEQTID